MINIEEELNKLKKKEAEITSQIINFDSTISTYKNIAWWLVVAGFIVIGLSLYDFQKNNTETGFGLNLYGDFLSGSVGSIWALAGILFIYIAFLGQRQQLLYQKIDLLYNHFEMMQTRNEISKQNETFNTQRFENTFFKMISLLNNTISETEVANKTGGIPAKGRSAISEIRRDMFTLVKEFVNNQNQADLYDGNLKIDKLDKEQIMSIYNQIYLRYRNILAHYYRTIYHIIKLIDTTESINKKLYISIITSQLSNSELVLLFYNGLHDNGVQRFKPLIERYSLFDNLDKNQILWPIMLDLYDDTAYGDEKKESIQAPDL